MKERITGDTKSELEAELIKVQIANLKKSWFTNPASWVSILTIVLALFGLAFQYSNHQTEAREAQIKLDKVKADLKDSDDHLVAVKKELDSKQPLLKQVLMDIDQATTELKQLTSDRDSVEAQLAALNGKLKELDEKAKNLPNTPANLQIQNTTKTALESVGKLQIDNQKFGEKAKGITAKLNASNSRSALLR